MSIKFVSLLQCSEWLWAFLLVAMPFGAHCLQGLTWQGRRVCWVIIRDVSKGAGPNHFLYCFRSHLIGQNSVAWLHTNWTEAGRCRQTHVCVSGDTLWWVSLTWKIHLICYLPLTGSVSVNLAISFPNPCNFSHLNKPHLITIVRLLPKEQVRNHPQIQPSTGKPL